MMTALDRHSTKNLSALLAGLTDADYDGQILVSGLSLDSRSIQVGDLFMAFAGTQEHGARYIPDAVKAGATAILIDADYELDLPKPGIAIIAVHDLSSKVGEIAHRFFDKPSESIKVVGITGTNGKTSTAWFIVKALSSHKQKTGFIGTLGTGLIDEIKPGSNTTPDAISVHKSLAEFRDTEVEVVVMEVSSHALDQHRVKAVQFHSVIFTNLSRDHLDYHESMQHYAESKRALFCEYDSSHRIINHDDDYGIDILESIETTDSAYSYGLGKESPVRSERVVQADVVKDQSGFITLNVNSPWGQGEINSNLLGQFNAYNLLGSLTSLCLLGIELQTACTLLSRVESVPGRMQVFTQKDRPIVIVDYAHTPDALAKALHSLKENCQGDLICLFGCGGDRDSGKRAEMGKVASNYANYIVLTNDNPRSEAPALIIENIRQGINEEMPVDIIMDRYEAIKYAISKASSNDIVLVAGKGHESTQQIGDDYFPFSDAACVKACLEQDS